MVGPELTYQTTFLVNGGFFRRIEALGLVRRNGDVDAIAFVAEPEDA